MNIAFTCLNCGRTVPINKEMGTKNRNHCPFCLWSKHIDLIKSGDRLAKCKGGMKPIGLTFKQEGLDRYGKEKQGELMLIHQCSKCGKFSINRIAGDDLPDKIIEVFYSSRNLEPQIIDQLNLERMNSLPDLRSKVSSSFLTKIKILSERDLPQIKSQLFGKSL